MVLSQVAVHGAEALLGVAALSAVLVAFVALLMGVAIAAGRRQARQALAEIEARLT